MSLEDEKKWIQESNKVVMDFSAVFESTYLKWAVTINGLHLGEEKYKSSEWLEKGNMFSLTGMRNISGMAGHVGKKELRVWDGLTASKIHETSISMLSGWAFINMYAVLEEFIFKIFKIYLNAYPLTIIQSIDFIDIRKKYHKRNESTSNKEEWEGLWNDRLEKWHRKKLYSGIESIVNSYISLTGLTIPSSYSVDFDLNDYAKTLGGVASIRNCFIHGNATVPEEVSNFCSTRHKFFFDFKRNEKFKIDLQDLMTLEYIVHTLTKTLNLSFFELACPDVKVNIKD